RPLRSHAHSTVRATLFYPPGIADFACLRNFRTSPIALHYSPAVRPVTVILVVDDHKDTCDALERLLKHKGYEATCVESADEAIRFLRRELPALIILDEMMPGMNGLELLHLLREDPRYDHIPVIS